jgi:NitT/TauT family transport system ATP-binding protein
MLRPDRLNSQATSACDLPDPATLVRISSISKKYETRSGETITALDEVSVDIARNQFVTIVGPSGCGKSTLMKIAGGIVAPSSGTISFDGRRLSRPSPEIGMVFQKATLMAWRTVLKNVLFPVEMLGLPTGSYEAKARELLKLVGLEEFANVYPQELSGGMQQRVSICRALIYDPKLLLMDEPFGALDAMTREEMVLELLRLWDERKKTVLFVTHSINEAVFLADRVLVMTARPGRVVLDLPIKLPRPRSPDMEYTSEFKDYVDQVRQNIYASKPGRKG